jgi:tetratricopeptide (TPR) repeat protein
VDAFALRQDARAARAEGRLADAAAILARAVELTPDEGLIALEYGDVLLEQGRAVEAVEAFRTAITLGAAAYGAEERFARALRWSGRHEEAHEAAMRALARKPTAPGVLRLCSVTAEKLGRMQDARTFAERALDGARQMSHPKLEVFETRIRELAERSSAAT